MPSVLFKASCMVVYRLTGDPGAGKGQSAVIPASETVNLTCPWAHSRPPGKNDCDERWRKGKKQARLKGPDTTRCVCGRMGVGVEWGVYGPGRATLVKEKVKTHPKLSQI